MRRLVAGSADVPSAQRAQHAQSLSQVLKPKYCSRFALIADGTSALPATRSL